MFAENSGLAVLVQICWPAAIAIYLTFAFSRRGPGRLWRDTAVLTVIIALIALWGQTITYWQHAAPGGSNVGGWRDASGVYMWPFFPLAVPGIALVIQALGFRRIPSAIRALAGTLVGVYSMLMGVWIT